MNTPITGNNPLNSWCLCGWSGFKTCPDPISPANYFLALSPTSVNHTMRMKHLCVGVSELFFFFRTRNYRQKLILKWSLSRLQEEESLNQHDVGCDGGAPAFQSADTTDGNRFLPQKTLHNPFPDSPVLSDSP